MRSVSRSYFVALLPGMALVETYPVGLVSVTVTTVLAGAYSVKLPLPEAVVVMNIPVEAVTRPSAKPDSPESRTPLALASLKI